MLGLSIIMIAANFLCFMVQTPDNVVSKACFGLCCIVWSVILGLEIGERIAKRVLGE